MHVLLILGRSRAEEALLLSASEDRIRVMRRGQADALEFRRVEGEWVSESGTPVEIGAILPVVEAGWDTEGLARAAAAMRTGFAVDRFGNPMTN